MSKAFLTKKRWVQGAVINVLYFITPMNQQLAT